MATKPLEKDFLSELPNDIALSILDKLDAHSSTMVGVLSRRWKQLPWLRSRLVIDIEKFKRKDMSAFTAATKSFLASSVMGDRVFETGPNLGFAEPDLHNLFKSCKQLETLKMVTCDQGQGGIIQGHVRNSKVRPLLG
ncbi:hypothetical protein PR202_ga28824 [Eleusine coracana subsp. coracana]|uniref:F-box domain-containing protein n=1 Tax=Eleusine coracana subsp. coracana TaxID=191504 RepID=A0AAV5DKS2_ELECO|nr:hypothetical protein PR202_ga28824 [Eleusine coracana subsp. coracana]